MSTPQHAPPPGTLAAADAEKILKADFHNVIKKVKDGRPLTNSERALIESRAAGSEDATTFAKNKVDLAELLGVTRRTIDQWKKLPGSPVTESNGTYNVGDWRRFVRENGLKTNAPAEVVGKDSALKTRKLLAEVEEREIRVGILRGEQIPVETVRESWTGHVARATAVLRAKFENELPPVLSGMDATGIQKECRKAIDEVLRCLHEK